MLAQEADRLGYSSAWAAEAYGSDAATVLGLGGGADRADRHRVGRLPDPGPHAGDDRDDRRHARHPVRRPVPARARRVRAAGVRGLARGAVRQAARPHPRVRRDRPDGAGPRDGAPRGRVLDPAAARRARARRCGSPSTRCADDIPVYLAVDRPEEPRADRRDRRRLAGHLLRPGARRRAAGSRVDRPGQGRQGPRRLRRRTHRARRRGRRPRGVRRAAAPLRRAVHRRHGQPGAELLQPPGGRDGLRGSGRGGPGPLPRPAAPGRRRGGAVRVHRPHLPDRAAGAHPGPAGGVRGGRCDHPVGGVVRRWPGRAGRGSAHPGGGPRGVRAWGSSRRADVGSRPQCWASSRG